MRRSWPNCWGMPSLLVYGTSAHPATLFRSIRTRSVSTALRLYSLLSKNGAELSTTCTLDGVRWHQRAIR